MLVTQILTRSSLLSFLSGFENCTLLRTPGLLVEIKRWENLRCLLLRFNKILNSWKGEQLKKIKWGNLSSINSITIRKEENFTPCARKSIVNHIKAIWFSSRQKILMTKGYLNEIWSMFPIWGYRIKEAKLIIDQSKNMLYLI